MSRERAGIVNVPIRNSYWILEKRLLAGEYPGAYDVDRATTQLRAILDAGIRPSSI
jgi:hypothetical protein